MSGLLDDAEAHAYWIEHMADGPDREELGPALTVTFLSEESLLTWLNLGETAGEIVMRDDHDVKRYGGMISVWENDNGEDMVTVSEVLYPDRLIVTVFLAAVERIEVA